MSNYMAIPGWKVQDKSEVVRNYHQMIREKEFGRLDAIASIIEDYFKISYHNLINNTRRRPVVHARQVAIYLARNHTKYSLYNIGKYFGNMSHATAIHCCNTIEYEIETYRNIREEIFVLERQVRVAFNDFVDGEYKLKIDREKNEVIVKIGVDFNVETFNNIHKDLKDKGIDGEFKVYLR